MIGKNILTLCEAQLIEIIQRWVDQCLLDGSKSTVKSVKYVNADLKHAFEVTFEDPATKNG